MQVFVNKFCFHEACNSNTLVNLLNLIPKHSIHHKILDYYYILYEQFIFLVLLENGQNIRQNLKREREGNVYENTNCIKCQISLPW